ncbi:MAG: hypothetical protein ACXV3E_07180 [Halobacteriota archaeon]
MIKGHGQEGTGRMSDVQSRLSSPPSHSKEYLDRFVNLYSLFFERWQKTSQERIDTSKYFITLLFVDTLVAVLGWVIGVKEQEQLQSEFTRMLFIAVFVTGAIISLTWFFRVYPLNLRYRSQRLALVQMEDTGLLPFKCLDAEKENKAILLKKNPLEDSLIWADRLNYYILPVSVFVIFVVLAAYVARSWAV